MRYHLLGIGGTAMAHLAVLLRDIDHDVTGSDQGVYSPMRELLEEEGIPFADVYDPVNLGSPDLVVVGNAISRGNEELEEVLARRIPFRSQAEVLKELFLENRRTAVVAGTHGKTTCSALLAWLLQDLDPGFLVGGIPLDFRCGAQVGHGEPFVVEGDEYDTAFFDKGPKFLHYRPWLVLLNDVEYDHADIYKDLDSYLLAFERLVNVIPANGRLVMYAHGAGVGRIRSKARCEVISFGTSAGDHSPLDVCVEPNGMRSFAISRVPGRFRTWLIGMHNIVNSTGCILAAHEYGVPFDRLAELLPMFAGVHRRQELLVKCAGGLLVYDDFAHHPTAIAATLRALRESLPGRRIWAVFEPRSWSMRMKVFQEKMPEAFQDADRVIIGPVFQSSRVAAALDPAAVASAIAQTGREAAYIPDIDEIARAIASSAGANDAVVILSNGAFGGLAIKLKELLA
ncbi:MAG: Mur ligase domain-containing protein [Acidobacteriota bacterium]